MQQGSFLARYTPQARERMRQRGTSEEQVEDVMRQDEMRLFENSPVVWGTPSCRFPLEKGEPILLNWFPLQAGGT